MSYKDGIPLLMTLGDEEEDSDDYMMGTVTPRKRCKKRNLLFGVVLCFALVLVVGLAVSITLGVTLKSGSSGRTGDGGHGTGGTSDGGRGEVSVSLTTIGMSSPPAPAVSVSVASSGGVTSPSIVGSTPVSIPISSSFSTSVLPVPPTSALSSTPPTSSLSSTAPSTPPTGYTAHPTSTFSAPQTSLMPSSSPVEMSSSSAISPTPSFSLTQSMSTAYQAISTHLISPSPTPFIPFGECLADDTLCPSPNDKRTYDSLMLANGLQVVVISDPETDLSGASMAVSAGSFNDPIDYEGLAHFCEHMLFLGTTAYPQQNVYSHYLSTHGGYDNAYTDTQETNFHFRVSSAYLKQPLDMFAHFFIDPLLSEDATASEMYAVNQEHKKNLLSDTWKMWQLLKNVSNPDHPFSQFSTGNFDTLNKSGVNDQLLKYYQKNYVANNMFLAVYGCENTSVLSSWIRSSFSAIPSNLTNDVPVTYDTTPFPAGYTGRVIHYYPEASTNTLTLYWQTPPLQGHKRNSVSDFLVEYLSHEGESGLFNLLQRRGQASALEAGVEVKADSFHLFTVRITLTETGLDGVVDVIRTVFHYTHLLASMSEGEYMEKWKDYCEVTKVNFDFAENESPNDYAVSITSTMRVVTDLADVLPNPRRYLPNYALTRFTAKHFIPNNTLIFIGTHQNNSADATPTTMLPIPILNENETIYGTPFHNEAIPDDLLTLWSYTKAWDTLDAGLALAGRNVFVPRNFTLLPPPSETEPQLTDDLSSETWVLPDTVLFPDPRVSFRCELRSGCNETSALRQASSELFASFVMAKLKPSLYGATQVGYTFEVEATARGLTLSFEGLSDSKILQQIISRTMNALVDFNSTDDGLFDLVKGDVVDQLTNYNYTTLPYRYTLRYIQNVVLERPYWTHEDVLQAMQNLSQADVLQFANTILLSDVSVSCLAHGNVDDDTADMYSQIVTDPLDMLQVPPNLSPGFTRTRVQLPTDGDYGLSIPALNPDDDNSVVNVIFQAGPVCDDKNDACSDDSVLLSLHLLLLEQVIADECFTQLRTIEKLGYVVWCFSTVHRGMGSFQTLVQSEVFTPKHVLNSTLRLLDSFYEDTVLSSNFLLEFSDKVDVLKQTLTKRDLMLEDKTDRVWTQVLSGQQQFNFRDQQVAQLVNLTPDGFRDFYNTLLLGEEHQQRLIVVVYGQGKEFDLPVKNVIDYQGLDQRSSTLPIVNKDGMNT